jgi:site-specific DNA recombinase
MRCAIYCRVSGSSQDIEGQKKSLPKFAKAQGWEIFKVYIDDAVSGASDNRPAFSLLLKDLIAEKFDILLVEEHDRISRSGDMAERGMILQTIKTHNVMLWSPSEGSCDLSGFAGEITSSIKLIIAAEERKNIIKRTVRGKKLKLEAGIAPLSSNQLPYARTYKKETGVWGLDKFKANLIKEAATRYIAGESMRLISEDLAKRGSEIKYVALLRVFNNFCGNKWTIKYKKHPEKLYEAFKETIKIPRLLDDETIKAVKNRIKFKTSFARGDGKKYLLNGFIRCSTCGRSLTGQISSTKVKGKEYRYRYYRHPIFSRCSCKAFRAIKADKIEDAVFTTIFENIYDEVGFNKAIAENMPDAKMINELKSSIELREKKLRKVEKDLDKLIKAFLDGVFTEDEIVKTKSRLMGNKKLLESDLEHLRSKFDLMPNIDQVTMKAEKIRLGLLDYFGNVESFKSQGYKHQRQFLHWMFEGLDEDGVHHAIYLTKRGKLWDYALYGRVTGTMTIYKDRVDYPDHDLPENFFKHTLINFVSLKHP